MFKKYQKKDWWIMCAERINTRGKEDREKRKLEENEEKGGHTQGKKPAVQTLEEAGKVRHIERKVKIPKANVDELKQINLR